MIEQARQIRRRFLPLAGALAALIIATPASAVTCTVSGTPIAFGYYGGISGDQVTTTATVTLSCTGPGTLAATITLSGGYGGGVRNRAMKPPPATPIPLSYSVWLDAGYTQIFGDGNSGTGVITINQTLPSGTTSTDTPIYALIPAGLNPAPGNYTDTLTLTVTY